MKRVLLILSVLLITVFTVAAQPKTTGLDAAPILRFYPNPATSIVSFDFQKSYDRGFSIQVFSFLGKKMYEASNIGSKSTINLNDFNRGIYIYQLYDKAGKLVESGKFQVSK